jgi:hypothetical protein
MRPRIIRLPVDQSTQAQRIITALTTIYGVSYAEVQRLYYRKGECVQAVKMHFNFNKFDSINS